MKITLVLPVRPTTKKTSLRLVHAGRRMRVLPSTLYEHFEEEVCNHIALLNPKARLGIAFPVNMRATFYRQQLRGDLVGFCQALCDALQKAGVLADDKYVMGFDGTRLALDREHPRIVVELETLEPKGVPLP